MLILVSTPIGNLADITLRALDSLKTCDYILCEDTRHSLILLRHYQIEKPLKSYHKFNESSRAELIIADLLGGKKICLISDAGTPGISDPGEALVKLCIENNIAVTAIPGPCAAIQALTCSGLQTDRFQFVGFLPKKENELKKELQGIFGFSGTTICYESPHRLLDVLECIHAMQPERELVVARELTKKFEEIFRGNAQVQLNHWKESGIKGEIVLVIGSGTHRENNWREWTIEEHVQWIEENYKVTQKEAIKLVATLRDVPKREIYGEIHHNPLL